MTALRDVVRLVTFIPLCVPAGHGKFGWLPCWWHTPKVLSHSLELRDGPACDVLTCAWVWCMVEEGVVATGRIEGHMDGCVGCGGVWVS